MGLLGGLAHYGRVKPPQGPLGAATEMNTIGKWENCNSCAAKPRKRGKLGILAVSEYCVRHVRLSWLTSLLPVVSHTARGTPCNTYLSSMLLHHVLHSTPSIKTVIYTNTSDPLPAKSVSLASVLYGTSPEQFKTHVSLLWCWFCWSIYCSCPAIIKQDKGHKHHEYTNVSPSSQIWLTS